ncbi:MAG: AAA family ATPase, partial [Planctomycetales bacterium]
PAAPRVIHYALRLVRATRVEQEDATDFVNEFVSWGAGPRAVQYLLLGAKARAVLDGRFFATTADVRSVSHPVLRHRVLTNFTADSRNITPDAVVDHLLEEIPETRAGDEVAPSLAKAFVG